MSRSRADVAVVRRHLSALDRAMRQLRQHTGRPLEAVTGDLDERWVVERGLQVCAQKALDIATHLCAGLGRSVPGYATAIDVLGEEGVVPLEFARRFRSVAGFRNVLVHEYLEVDLGLLHTFLNQGLPDFEQFAECVQTWLER